MSTNRKEIATCPKCGAKGEVILWDSLNTVLDPIAGLQLINGTLFNYTCAKCGHVSNLNYEMLYHDMKNKVMIYYVSGKEKIDEADALFDRFEEMNNVDMSSYRTRIVYDQNSLREKAAVFSNGLDDRVIELLKLFFYADAYRSYPGKDIGDAFFAVVNDRHILEFIGETRLSAEISPDTYAAVEKEYHDALAELGEYEPVIDFDWAKKFYDEQKLAAEEQQ